MLFFVLANCEKGEVGLFCVKMKRKKKGKKKGK